MNDAFDSLILDCNTAIKMILSGNYIAWCGTMQRIAVRLAETQVQVQKEIKDRDDKIKTLEQFVKDLNNGGADVGSN